MQPSDVSAYLNVQPAKDVGAQKRADASRGNGVGQAGGQAVRLDTTSVSAGARALTFHKQADIASQTLSAERLSRLRAQRPQPERIAEAIVSAELDA